MDTIDAKTKYATRAFSIARNTATQSTTWDPSPDGDRILVSLDILWAPGHVALTGVRVLYNGTTLLPWNQPNSFLVGDNERRVFAMGLYIAKPLVIVQQNNDNVAHTHYLTATMVELDHNGTLTPYTAPLVVV